MYAGANGKPGRAFLVAGSDQKLASGIHGVGRMVGAREAGNEERDELVPCELVDDAVPDVDCGGRLRVEARHQPAELLRADSLGERSRPADVGEEKRGLDLGAPRPLLERVNAAAADPPVDARGAEPEETEDVPRAPERSVTELATRIRRNRAADPPHRRVPTEVAAPLTRQDASPFLVH